MECISEWRISENESSSASVEGVSDERSLLFDVDAAPPSDTPENTSDDTISVNSAIEDGSTDDKTPENLAPENDHSDNRAPQNSTADIDIPEIDIPETKNSNHIVSDNTSSENEALGENNSDITAPDTGDQASNPPVNSASENRIPDTNVSGTSDSNNTVPDNTSPEKGILDDDTSDIAAPKSNILEESTLRNSISTIGIPETGDSKNIGPDGDMPEITTERSTSTDEDITIGVVVQQPDSSPTMATFETPYDSPTPSPTSTTSLRSNSSSAASNVSTNMIPAPPPPPPPTPPQSPPTSSSLPLPTSLFSETEHLLSPTPEPSKQVEDPTEEGILETTSATSEQDLVASLHLIADSIAQQRQVAAKSILHSGFYWSILVIVFEYLYRVLWHTSADWIMILLLWVCFVIATLSGIKMWTGGYLDEAERVGRWSWLFGNRWASHFDGSLRAENDDGWSPLRWTFCQGVWFRVAGGHVERAVAWCALKRDEKKKDALRQSVGGVYDMGKAWEEYSAGFSFDGSGGLEVDIKKESLEEGWMQDKVFVSRFNGRVIATMVIRVMPVDTDSVVTVTRDEEESDSNDDLDGHSHPAHLESALRPEKVVIRSWTVLQKYRGSGVGLGILQFVIEYARDLGLQGPQFAVDHANSLRALPKLLNGSMDRDDKRARDRLAKEIRKSVAGQQGNGKKD